MEALQGWLDWLGSILWGVWESITNIGNWITGAVEQIKFAVTIPFTALDTLNKLVVYFPSYVWVPVLALLYLCLVFRILKIVLSGG